MPDSGKMIVRCSNCGIRLQVKASSFLEAGKMYCQQCTSMDARVAAPPKARLADDDQIVEWLLEGEPSSED